MFHRRKRELLTSDGAILNFSDSKSDYAKRGKSTSFNRTCAIKPKKVKASLTKQVGNIKFPKKDRGEVGEVRLFNSMVMGIQNYYQLATDISIDCGDIGRTVNTVLKKQAEIWKNAPTKKRRSRPYKKWNSKDMGNRNS